MKKVPKLRFPEFEGEWEEFHFKNLFKEVREKTNDTKKYKLYSLTIENGVIPKSKRYEREFLISKEENYKIVHENEYVYNPMNLRFGALGRYMGRKPVSVSGYYNIFKLIDNSAYEFWDNFLKLNRMMYLYNTIATGSLIEKRRVHFSQFIELTQPIPSPVEQQKIATFFSLMDKKIQKQQQKVEALEVYKKGMMQKIFSQEIRFKDENGNEFPKWEDKKLNEFIERVTRKNKPIKSTLPLTISAQYGLVDQESFFNKTVASSNLENYYLLRQGEFAYNKSYSAGYPWGAIKRLDDYDEGVLSSLYICFLPKSNVVSDYLTYYFETNCWHKEISMIAVEGARNHGLLNISVSDFFETNHFLPSIKEQIKIASFMNVIDRKLENQRDKLKLLKQWKEGLVQHMFI